MINRKFRVRKQNSGLVLIESYSPETPNFSAPILVCAEKDADQAIRLLEECRDNLERLISGGLLNRGYSNEG